MNRWLKPLAAIAVIALLALPLLGRSSSKPAPTNPVPAQEQTVRVKEHVAPSTPSSGVIEQAFRNHSSALPVTETGTVAKILADDTEGSRHQRFIVRLASGHTILIAHNIDIAPRVAGLREGDQVTFSGNYEWKPQGGVVHWTHHDPSGRHAAGYIFHNDRNYQ
jgi:hypothetical protein